MASIVAVALGFDNVASTRVVAGLGQFAALILGAWGFPDPAHALHIPSRTTDIGREVMGRSLKFQGLMVLTPGLVYRSITA